MNVSVMRAMKLFHKAGGVLVVKKDCVYFQKEQFEVHQALSKYVK